MKKKMNKKGDGDPLSLQQLLFKAAEIAAGAFIIIIMITLVLSSVRNSHSQQVSRDFTSTLQTMSSYPYTTYFVYTADLSEGAITIRENSVRVDLKRGSYTAPIRVPKGTKVQEKHFYNPLNLPIISHRDEILFSGEDVKEIQCEKLYKLPKGTTFFIEYDVKNQEEQTKMNHLKNSINRIHDLNKRVNKDHKINIETKQKENTQPIKISFQEDDTSTKLVYDAARDEHEMFACYARKEFTNELFSPISFFNVQFKETDTLELILPKPQHLDHYLKSEEYRQQRQETNTQTEIDLMDAYSKTIYDILLKIVRDN